MNPERVISVSLTEAEWQAFVSRHPKPVDWLRDQIRAEVQPVAQESSARRERQVA